MTAKTRGEPGRTIATRNNLTVRITTQVPSGVDAQTYAEQLKAKGNPVVCALPEQGRVLLAELKTQSQSRIKRAFNRFKRMN